MSLPPAEAASNSNTALVRYCRLNEGRRVGDGECWALANEAFKAAGKKRPGGQLRVWGREVDYKSEGVMPGDVIEFESMLFPSYVTGPKHTAIGSEGGKGRIIIAEQNFGGTKVVSFRAINLNSKLRGNVKVYRPS